MDISKLANVIDVVKTPLSYLVLVTLLVASLSYYFFRESKAAVKISIFALVFLGFSIAAYYLFNDANSKLPAKIIFMDSIVKVNIYDKENREKGIINSQRLRDIVNSIEGINAELIIEPTSYEWKYEDNTFKMNPDLIIIHYSAFEIETVGHNDARAKSKFRSFVKYMKNTKSKFLIYTRGEHFEKGEDKQRMIEESGIVENRFHFYKLPEPYTFKDPTIEREFKTLVKSAMAR